MFMWCMYTCMYAHFDTGKSGAPVMVAWDSTTDTIHDPKPLDKVSEIQSSPVDIQSSSAVTLNLSESRIYLLSYVCSTVIILNTVAKNCSHLNFNVGIVTIRKRFQASQTLYCHATVSLFVVLESSVNLHSSNKYCVTGYWCFTSKQSCVC